MNIKENYQQYVSRYASEVAALKRKNTGFITGELLAFGGILAFLICYFALDGDTQNYLLGAALCLIAYLGIRRLDDKNKEKIEHLSALLKVYQDEIKALEGDFSPFVVFEYAGGAIGSQNFIGKDEYLKKKMQLYHEID